MTDNTKTYARLHAVYLLATGADVPLTMSRIFTWEAWCARGWESTDLILVVKHIKSRIKEGRRWPESFRFSNLIENTSRFEEDLSEARALNRIPKVDHGKAEVLRATGRPLTDNQTTARPVGDIVALVTKEEAWANWEKMKKEIQ